MANGPRKLPHQVVHQVSFKIDVDDMGTTVTGPTKLPAALIIDAGVNVTVGFNRGSTAILDIGFSDPDNSDALATDISIAAIGSIAADELAAVTNVVVPEGSQIKAVLAGTGTAATTGTAYVWVTYIPLSHVDLD